MVLNAKAPIDRSEEYDRIWRQKHIALILEALEALDSSAVEKWIRETWPLGIGLFTAPEPSD